MGKKLSHHKIENHTGGLPAATIHIGQEHTVVGFRIGNTLTPPTMLAMGTVKTANLFKHNPPTEAEMEQAIMVVEDELFRIRHLFVTGTSLSTSDKSLRAIAKIAGVSDHGSLTITRELVEHTFNRLAAIVQGRPARLDSIPTHAEFCATLLILREFMHHLDFAAIEVADPAA